MRSAPATLLAVLAITALAAAGEDPVRARLRALTDAGRFAEALAAAEEALAADPACQAALEYRAWSLHRLGLLDRAREAYERALAADPKGWWAWVNLGELLAAQGRFDAAAKAGETAVALLPQSRDLRERLSRIHRDGGDYERALVSVMAASAAGVDPAWCHAEQGHLWWVLGNLPASEDEWRKARAAGADPEAVAHGLRLVEWDRGAGSAKEREEQARRRLGFGEEWVFDVGGMTVHTRVGARLPSEVERLLSRLRRDYGRFLGLSDEPAGEVHLHLSRTMEQHEIHRRREFPTGYSGKAFFVQRPPAAGGGYAIYAAWPAPGLLRTLSHEMVHALLRTRTGGNGMLPAWLDEGLATYLEIPPDERTTPDPGGSRPDLLASLPDSDVVPSGALFYAAGLDFTGAKARARYAQAWSMVHFLLHGMPGGPERLAAILDAARRPAPVFVRELHRICGVSESELDAAWRAYLSRLRAL